MSLAAAVVLVLDPDAASRDALGALLRQEGARPVLCADETAALELLNREPADILLADLAVGDGGIAFLRTVEERWPGLPTIVLAGNASVADAVGALRAGAADFIEKPFNAEE